MRRSKSSYCGEEDDEKVKDETCLVAHASSEIFLRVDLEPDEWIKDSGCSKHMTSNQKLLSTYKAYNGGNIIFGSNLRGNIIGKGTISNDSLKIDNVEHVDNLGFNLLSIGQICNSKCRVTFFEHDSEITKDSRVIGRGIRKKGLWHRRLGHANMRLIQSLASKELVRTLPKLKFDQHFCDACKMGKQAHDSHKAKNIVSTTRCLELLHMDLFGPSANGYNSYLRDILGDILGKDMHYPFAHPRLRTYSKGILIEPVKKKDQILLDEETALKLQAVFDEEEILAKEKAKKNASTKEQEELSVEEKATLFQQLLEKRRKHFAAKRAEEKRNKPQQKLNRKDNVAFKRVNTFEDFRTELVKGNERGARTELAQEIIKKELRWKYEQ
ncbi:retrovirus-related pol polyprotein from transposon TNT 1-94 [Tanacetum coccineum]